MWTDDSAPLPWGEQAVPTDVGMARVSGNPWESEKSRKRDYFRPLRS